MMVIEQGTVPAAALPIAVLKQHLRLGTGFGDDAFQEALLESHLRAALAAVEGRIGKVLLTRRFLMQLSCWRGVSEQALPWAPVSAVISLTLVTVSGLRSDVAATQWQLMPDLHRPRLAGRGLLLPAIPADGLAEIVFDAGFAGDWAGVPPDLAQAVLLLAAQFYEQRHEAGLAAPGLPVAVQGLTERWRNVRVLGGGGA